MRIISLDISLNRTGVIISDEDGIFAAYKKVIKTDRKNFVEIYKEYEPKITFIGLPLMRIGKSYFFIKNFAHSLREVLSPFIFICEDFTTSWSKKLGYKDKDLDFAAALLIFEKGKSSNWKDLIK